MVRVRALGPGAPGDFDVEGDAAWRERRGVVNIYTKEQRENKKGDASTPQSEYSLGTGAVRRSVGAEAADVELGGCRVALRGRGRDGGGAEKGTDCGDGLHFD